MALKEKGTQEREAGGRPFASKPVWNKFRRLLMGGGVAAGAPTRAPPSLERGAGSSMKTGPALDSPTQQVCNASLVGSEQAIACAGSGPAY